MGRRAFFFDRDGIVNTRIHGGYVTCVEEFVFLPEFFDVFRRITQAGYLAVLVTNQQGVGKGLMTEQALHAVHGHMQSALFAATGRAFDDIRYCPDLASAEPSCRKPSPAMLLAAMQQWDIDPQQSWMIGDTVSDAQAAVAAGVRAVLIGEFGETALPACTVYPSLSAFLEAIDLFL